MRILKQSGFMMPSIIILMGVLSLVGFSTMSAVSTSQLAVLKQTYFQIAHVASKAAFDLAKEEYEADPDYSGTLEQDLVVTARYRTTIEVEVLSTSGNIKNIQATGRVYIPDESTTASFVRDIKGGIIRDGITVGNPADYNPLVWLDAGDSSTLLSSSSGANQQFVAAVSGSSAASVVEQRGSDASNNPGQLSFGSSDLEMAWGGSNTGTQVIGLRFTSIDIPQGATVTGAYIQFQTDETKQAGDIEFEIEGVLSTNAPGWSGNYAVSNAAKTNSSVDWAPVDWNVVGAKGSNERTPSLVPIVQEIADQGGWNADNSMAFSITPDPIYEGSGQGIRTAESSGSGAPTLFIEWDTGSLEAPSGGGVGEWQDISGNGNHARTASAYGASAPTRVDSQLNGDPIVRFRDENNSLLLSSFSNTSGTAMTAVMVARPYTSSPDLSRFVSALNTSSSSDTSTQNGAALLYKSNTTGTNSMRTYYNGGGAEYVAGAVDDQFAIYSTRLSSSYVERLRKNGIDNYTNTHSSVNYTINQFFFGGTRSGGTLSNLADIDVAEVIVYPTDLQCSEMYEVELYLSSKWGVSLDGSAGCS
jgi:hypothetical protein